MATANPDLPTGTVNLYDPGFTACPFQVSATLRASLPVARTTGPGGGAATTVVLSRYEDVVQALSDHETFSSDIGLGGAMAPAPVQVDPPEHTRFRDVLRPGLSTQIVDAFEPRVRADVHRLIDGFITNGACEFQQAFAVPLPCHVLLQVMGLPASDLGELLAMKDDIIHPENRGARVDETRQSGITRARDYFDAVITARLAAPGDDILSDLARATQGPEPFTRQDVLRVCLNLLLGGLDTMTATLGCAMAYLAAHPEQRAVFQGPRAAIMTAVRELMRTEAPVMMVPRRTTRAVKVGDTEIQAGTLVMLLLGSASADEGVFPEPDRVDLARHPNPHVAFGFGRHRCIGERLGLLVLATALEVWHARIPNYSLGPGTLTYSAVIRTPTALPLVWPGATGA